MAAFERKAKKGEHKWHHQTQVEIDFEGALKMTGNSAESVTGMELVVDRRHVTLPWHMMGRSRTVDAIENICRANLGHYSVRLSGVPVAYGGFEPVGVGTRVHANHPCMHVDVDANYVVFRAVVGATYEATVESLSPHTVTASIAGQFPVVCHQRTNKLAREQWDSVDVGDKVRVRLTKVRGFKRVYQIDGMLTEVYSNSASSKAVEQPSRTVKFEDSDSE